jgi:hypothetical protein
MENLIITLSVGEAFRELWVCIHSFIVEEMGWKTMRNLFR